MSKLVFTDNTISPASPDSGKVAMYSKNGQFYTLDSAGNEVPVKSNILSGAGAPSVGTGDNGDLYLDTTSGNVHKKTTGTWSVTANIKGPTGATGAAGSPTLVRDITGSGDYSYNTANPNPNLIAVTALPAFKYVYLPGCTEVPDGWPIEVKDETGSCDSTKFVSVIPKQTSELIDADGAKKLSSAYASVMLYNNRTAGKWFTRAGFGTFAGDSRPPTFVSSGLVIQLDATDTSTFTLTSTRVDQWRDKSGNANHFGTSFAGTTYNPVYDSTAFGGKGAVTFASGQKMLQGPASITGTAPTHNNFTVIAVGAMKYAGYHGFLLWDRTNNKLVTGGGPGVGEGLGWGTVNYTKERYPANTLTCFAFTNNGSSQVAWWNGIKTSWFKSTTAYNGISTTMAQLLLGSNPNESRWDITQLYVYNRVLTDAEIASMTSYLRYTFGYASTRGAPTANIILDGDSIFWGQGGATKSLDYETVRTNLGLTAFDYFNTSVPGVSLSTSSSAAATAVDPLYNSSLAAKKNVVVTYSLVNSIAPGNESTLHTQLQNYCAARRAAGFKVIVCTCTDRSGQLASWQTSRANLNAMIVANWASYADGLADFAANSNMGPSGAAANTTYFTDGVHPTDAGHVILAGILSPVISGIIT